MVELKHGKRLHKIDETKIKETQIIIIKIKRLKEKNDLLLSLSLTQCKAFSFLQLFFKVKKIKTIKVQVNLERKENLKKP